MDSTMLLRIPAVWVRGVGDVVSELLEDGE